MTVGENIKRIRKQRNLTQKQLGEIMGISQSAVGQFENSKTPPKNNTIFKFAEALSVSPAELFEGCPQSYVYGRSLNEDYKDYLDIKEKAKENYERYREIVKDAEPDERRDALIIDDILVTEKNLLRQYRKLNLTGKAEAIKRVSELSYFPKFTGDDDIPFD